MVLYITCILFIYLLSYHKIYFHSVDPYRITKSIWLWKHSNLLKKSRSEVNIKVYSNQTTGHY